MRVILVLTVMILLVAAVVQLVQVVAMFITGVPMYFKVLVVF